MVFYTVQPEKPLSVVTMYNNIRQGVSLLLRQFSVGIARRVLVFGINPLALELDIQIVAHHLCKM